VTAGPILVLGGTAEARQLAAELLAQGVPVTSSLAGRVSRPRLPAGEVRLGGFGGPEGLARWLRENGAAAVVDATHPFAEGIAATAAGGCELAGTPLLRLARPGWRAGPGDRWTWVDDLPEAAARVPELGSRVLLTTGRQGLPAFAGVGDAWFLIRCIDPPEPPLPPRHELLLDRGPYTVEGELALIDAHRIDLVATKDSGGEHTAAKLEAARLRGLPVLLVRRPPRPESVAEVDSVERALAWALARSRGEADRAASSQG
jgi:precorrin-6A/cobalt-precorrin-6A reductase